MILHRWLSRDGDFSSRIETTNFNHSFIVGFDTPFAANAQGYSTNEHGEK